MDSSMGVRSEVEVKAPKVPSMTDVLEELERNIDGLGEMFYFHVDRLAPILKPDYPRPAESESKQADDTGGLNIRLRRLNERITAYQQGLTDLSKRIDF